MRYRDYVIKRLLQIIPAFFGLTILIFLIARVMPGDPARLALGPDATEEQVAQLRRSMGLDKPLHAQYVSYVQQVFGGSLGLSLYSLRDVVEDLARFFPATLELVTFSMAVAVIVGVFLGVVSAVKRDTWVDQVTRVFALSGVSLPRFWSGIMLQLVIASYFGLLPITGRIDPELTAQGRPAYLTGFYLIDSLLAADGTAWISSMQHLILPAITLSLSPIAQIMRIVRASMIEQLRKGYVTAARANGMPDELLTYKYMLKNAFTAALTIIGLLYGFFLGGAFVVETVFSWPGMARYGVRALLFKDFNAIIGVTIVIGLAYLAVNFLVDLLYSYLDPRIRLGMEQVRAR